MGGMCGTGGQERNPTWAEACPASVSSTHPKEGHKPSGNLAARDEQGCGYTRLGEAFSALIEEAAVLLEKLGGASDRDQGDAEPV